MNRITFLLLLFLLLLPHLVIGEQSLQLPEFTADQNQQPQLLAQQQVRSEIRDIMGPLTLPQDHTQEVSIAIIAGTLVLLIAYFFYRWWKNRRLVVPTAAENALVELNKARSLFLDDRLQEYAEKTTEILRTYLQDHFGIPATSQTTREFLLKVAGDDQTQMFPWRDSLKECFEKVDLIKFARVSPDQEQVTQIEQSVTAFITTTSREEQ